MNEPVPIYPDLECSWRFVLPVEVRACDEQNVEIAALCSDLYTAFDEFIVPLTVTFTVQVFPEGTPLPMEIDDLDARLESYDVSIVDDDGVELNALREKLLSQGVETAFIGKIDFEDVAVNVRRRSGDVYASQNVASAEYKHGKLRAVEPYQSPLQICIYYDPNYDCPQTDAEQVYQLQVKSKTNIWFDDSAVAQQNAARLAEFLNRIDDILPVVELERETNRSFELEDIY